MIEDLNYKKMVKRGIFLLPAPKFTLYIFQLKIRMSKETKLSETAGAQVWRLFKALLVKFFPHKVAEVANIMQNNVDKLLERLFIE